MKFYKKLTLTLFLLCFSVVGAICLVLYIYLSQAIKAGMIKNYNNELSQLADAFLKLEKTTEIIGVNALNSLKIIEENSGIPSNQQLIYFSKMLSINHIYIANSTGSFIRSTNGPIDSSIFSYCNEYINLLNGKADIFITPIIPSSDEPTLGFYKYIMMPNYNRSEILEVSIAFNFIGKILQSLLNNNQEILAISLYAPTGQLLGSVSRADLTTNKHEKIIKIFKSFENDLKNCCECKVKKLLHGKEGYSYKFVASISTRKITDLLAYLSLTLFAVFIVSVFICIFISRLLSSYLVARLRQLDSSINKMIVYDEIKPGLNMKGGDEISDIANQFDILLEKLHENKKQLILAEKMKALFDLAASVAHDIRSPLVALDIFIKDIKNISEEQRIRIRNSVNRINDIANNLLTQYRDKKNSDSDITSNIKPELISDLLMSLISEKRSQYRNHITKLIVNFEEDAYGRFSILSSSEFNRALSNLINNAYEALASDIKITLQTLSLQGKDMLNIQIQDNGSGISPESLQKIMNRESISNKIKGHGLGLPSAINMIEKCWGGRFHISSSINVGTSVGIILPQCSIPKWFHPQLIVSTNDTIVVVDDDVSIHQVWENRFKEKHIDFNFANHFSPQDLLAWHNGNHLRKNIFLIDYEFIGHDKNGLDIISELNIVDQAYLVTSRHEDSGLRKRCEEIGLKIIPKTFSVYIPIILLTQDNLRTVDFIFIDDSDIITSAWVLHGQARGKIVAPYNSMRAFNSDLDKHELNTPVFVDSDLNDKMKGQDYAKILYEKGFKNIYLATGFPASHFPVMYWIKEIVGKEPPF